MDNIIPLPDHELIEQEAADWLASLDSDLPLSEPERESLREWMARSPAHREELHNLNAFWGSEVLTELMVPLGRNDANPGWQKPARPAYWPSYQTSLAAMLSVVMALGVWLFWQPIDASNGFYMAAVGQQHKQTLADGSVIHLNTNSQVEVVYSKAYRNIRLLQGEVHFEVVKGPDHPFRVYTPAGRVQAVGTAFTLRAEGEAVDILVTEGTIALASFSPQLAPTATPEKTPATVNAARLDPFVGKSPKNLATMQAGQALILKLAEGPAQSSDTVQQSIKPLSPDELKRRQAWRNGLLDFSGEPLEEVVREISRYTTISIDIVDPSVKSLQIGGRFRVGNIESLFAVLESNFGVEVNRLSYNRVELSAAKQP